MTAILVVLAVAGLLAITAITYLGLRALGIGTKAHYDIINGRGADLR